MIIHFYISPDEKPYAMRVWDYVPRIGDFVMLGKPKIPYIVEAVTFDESHDWQEAGIVVAPISAALEKKDD